MKSEVLFEPVQLPVVKIAKEQVFGANTSGEKQSFELFSRGQRSAGQRFAGVATLTKKPEDSGYEVDHPQTKEPGDSDMGEKEVIPWTLS